MKMKTIEQKAKRYDEALQRTRRWYDANTNEGYRAIFEEIFSELKEESEDERIKKRICKLLWDNAPYEEAQEYITWLEKQGEQKATIEMKSAEESLGIDSDTYNKIVDECVYGEQKPANKVEPKFKIGDNIEPVDSCPGSPLTIYKICDGFYETNQGTLDFEFENNWRLTEQKSAWSEEDERNMGGIVSDLEYLKDKANAKTLKERFQDKIDWLKSLRPQNRWKPSESQLEALDDFIYAKYPNIEKYEASVKSLYQDLKKLKG